MGQISNELNRGLVGDDPVGFAVDARDGRVGKVDHVNSDRTYMVVTTRRWPLRRRHVVSATAVASVDPGRRVIYVRTSKREILSGPSFDAVAVLDGDREMEAEDDYARDVENRKTDAYARE